MIISLSHPIQLDEKQNQIIIFLFAIHDYITNTLAK